MSNEKTGKTVKDLLPGKRNDTTDSVIHKAAKTVSKARMKQTTEGETEAAPDKKKADKSMQDLARELDKLFSPAHFRGIVRAPADLMLATSGRRIWDLPAAEVDTLATTGSTCARYFLMTDPKWLALTLFSMSILTTYGTRTALHIKESRAEKRAEHKKEMEAIKNAKT